MQIEVIIMITYKQELKTGERAMYNTHNAKFVDCTFADGESPLKECSNLELDNCIFKWKYPLWYCDNIKVHNTTWLDTARSGIWQSHVLSRQQGHQPGWYTALPRFWGQEGQSDV